VIPSKRSIATGQGIQRLAARVWPGTSRRALKGECTGEVRERAGHAERTSWNLIYFSHARLGWLAQLRCTKQEESQHIDCDGGLERPPIGRPYSEIRAGSGQARGDLKPMISGLIVAFLMLWHMQSPKTFPPTTLRRRSTVCDWLDQSVKSGRG
jgi:hypothetical protein